MSTSNSTINATTTTAAYNGIVTTVPTAEGEGGGAEGEGGGAEGEGGGGGGGGEAETTAEAEAETTAEAEAETTAGGYK